MTRVIPIHPRLLERGQYFPSPQRARSMLTRCGFRENRLPRPGRETIPSPRSRAGLAKGPTVVLDNSAGAYEVRCY